MALGSVGRCDRGDDLALHDGQRHARRGCGLLELCDLFDAVWVADRANGIAPRSRKRSKAAPQRLRDVRSAVHRMGEQEGRVGTRLEGRHEGLEARARQANGPPREVGGKRSTPFPAFPLPADGRLSMEVRRGLIVPSLRSSEKTAVSAPPSTEIE